MMERHLGILEFKKGVENLLNKYNQSSFETDDLWRELRAALKSKIDVKAIYDQWVRRAGFPIVEVWRREKETILSQQRFVKPFTSNRYNYFFCF